MKILYLTSRFPYPLEKGDKLRAYHQLRELARDHEVILWSVSDGPVAEEHLAHLRTFCAEVHVSQLSKPRIALNLLRAAFKGWPYQVGYFYTRRIHRQVSDLIGRSKPDAIFCQLIRMAEYVREVRGIPRTLDYMDTYSKGMERRVGRERWPKRTLIRSEWKRLLRYEREVFTDFTAHLIISAQDRDHITHPDRAKILVIPNGVDWERYQPLDRPKKYDLMFEGNMAYPPNVESAVFLIREVMPLVWKQRPDTTVVIAGATPAREVLDLANDRVTVTGWVEDMREVAAASRISLAPMLISIGMQNKILQAFAMQLPCVVSALANNAIGAEPGRDVLVAEQPSEYAAHILRLLSNPEEAKTLASHGNAFVRQHYDWGRLNEEIVKTLKG
jgi:sugar transferase (PEP-CTERM/EpsH1 system associated)